MVTALAVFLPLLGAFLTAWLTHRNERLSLLITRLFLLAGLAAILVIAARLGAVTDGGLENTMILRTGVMTPPLSIDLKVTGWSALAAVVVYVGALLGVGRFSGRIPGTQPLLLTLVTTSLGLMFATDFFNSFVFIEIGSIITIGLTAAGRCRRRWEVALKTAMISGLVTILYLLAVVIVYRTTGELRLTAISTMTGFPAILVSGLLLTVIMTEIKAFPLSGWGLDFYQGVDKNFAAVYSSTWSLAVLLWSARMLTVLPLPDPGVLARIGAGGLVLGQLAGLRQRDPGRMMGYSTSAYASILLILAGTVHGADYLSLTLLFFTFASLSKTTVFLMADPEEEDDPWKKVSGYVLLLPLLCITGIPPFPVFWAKIRMLTVLADISPLLMGAVILGLFFESVYIYRLWSSRTGPWQKKRKYFDAAFMGAALLAAGTVWTAAGAEQGLSLSGELFRAGFVRDLFLAIFAGGTLLSLPGAFRGGPGEKSPAVWMLVSGVALTLLPLSGNGLTFYVLWEISAFAAVIGVSKGARPSEGTFWFAVFAGAAGYLLLASLVLSDGAVSSPGIPMLLVAAAALLKMGQGGAHLWNVRAYSTAPSTMAAFLSGTSSKAAVFLLVFSASAAAILPLGTSLAWIGALTALGMAAMASLESDYKKVLAYASVSQLGYVIMGIGLTSVLGWTAAIYHTFNHFLFKSILFLGAAGVIARTGTSDYDSLGGLVKRMPLTFTFTLISVIAFAGVPPLSGFGSKWLLYNALVEQGMLPLALVAMFASVVAFLYAFRLLYAVFLGQLAPRHYEVKEAPLAVLAPQGVFTAVLMALSFRPTLLLDRLVPAVASIAGLGGEIPVIEGTALSTSLGYWDAWSVGMMVMGVFGFAFVFYWISGRRPIHVGQLDIGFAGELPPSPEEVHYAGDFFRPFRRALAFLPEIHASKVFGGIVKTADLAGDVFRSLFTGDARTYLLHSLIILTVMILWMKGGTP